MKKVTSTALTTIPFISATDSTKTQMSAKQMSQALLNENQRHPYVIGDEYGYLTENTSMFLYVCEEDSKVLYNNNDLIILFLKQTSEIRYFEVPPFKETYSRFSVKLKYISDKIELNKGDLLFTYDGFSPKTLTPQYGINCYTLFNSFFSFTHEDPMVISESLAKKLKHYKTEKLHIPIYANTKLKMCFDKSKTRFFPYINDVLEDGVFCIMATDKKGKSVFKKSTRNLLNDLNDNKLYNSEPIKTKLITPIVDKITVHRTSNQELILRPLDILLSKLAESQLNKIKHIRAELEEIFLKNDKMINKVLNTYYNLKSVNQAVQTATDLVYIIEVDLIEENDCLINSRGDKLTNRYGGKGVISLVLPDELMPVDMNGKIVDLITSPISVPGRSNFGQLLEGMVSNAVEISEKSILNDRSKENVIFELQRLYNVVEILYENYETDYLKQIKNLIKDIEINQGYLTEFINDIEENGLFVTAPVFNKINLTELQKTIQSEYNVDVTRTDIIFKKELLNHMNELLDLGLPEATDNRIVKNQFCVNLYYLKLYKIAQELIRVRDVGSINAVSKINTKKSHSEFPGARIGYMENFCFIAHGAYNIIYETYGAKSDNIQEKQKMHLNMIMNGVYHQNKTDITSAPIKLTIDAYLKFLNE